jgi:2-epi-5-epi-valiolone synthase
MSYIEIVQGQARGDDQSIQLEALADYGYTVRIERNLFAVDNPALAHAIGARSSLIILSPTIASLYGDRIRSYAEAHLPTGRFAIITCPSGEKNKLLETVFELCAEAKAFQLDRDGLFIGIGGGIVLDLVGFTASMYRRGTKFLKVPSTLVGQVDVAVGLKTGVNAFRSKNILGSYYPAFATFNDPLLLATLPIREIRCGLAEVIKMGLVCDDILFDCIDLALTDGAEHTLRQIDYGIYARAMLRMAEELQPNLLEAELERVVDFGHTFSMRFEIESNHRILHGEAVAIDMALSCCISEQLGYMAQSDCDKAVSQIQRTGLPVWDDEVCCLDNLEASLEEVRLHRKAINLVLPRTIGDSIFIKFRNELSNDVLSRSLERLFQYSNDALA